MERAQAGLLSQNFGKHIGRGAEERNFVGIRRGKTTRYSALTLGRFHPIKFENRLGISVYAKLNILETGGKTPLVIYNELFECYSRYHELYHGSAPAFDFQQTAFKVETAIQQMLMLMSGILGDAIEYEVRPGEDGKYCFYAYQQIIENMNHNVLQVGPALKKMKRWNPKMFDLFLMFLSAFSSIGIMFWFKGHYGYHSTDCLDQMLHDYDDLEPEYRQIIRNNIKKYSEGLPATCEHKISLYHKQIDNQGRAAFNVDMLLAWADVIEGCEPVKKLIREGVEIIRKGKTLVDYGWHPEDEEWNYDSGLRYEDQHCIAWDVDDHVWELYEEYINIEAQEGVIPPFNMLCISPRTTEIFKPDTWPIELSDFINNANDYLNEYLTPKKAKKK